MTRSLDAMKKATVPVFAYSNFIRICLHFAILAFTSFLMVKQFNRMKKAQPPPAAPAPLEEVTLLRESRDSLRRRDGRRW